MAEELFICTNDVTFKLYLEFLYDTLPLLDEVNCQLQISNMNIYKTYCTIYSFRQAFTSSVLKDPAILAYESENNDCTADVKFHGLNFNQILTDWQSSTDLTEEAMDNIRSCCVRFMLTC